MKRQHLLDATWSRTRSRSGIDPVAQATVAAQSDFYDQFQRYVRTADHLDTRPGSPYAFTDGVGAMFSVPMGLIQAAMDAPGEAGLTRNHVEAVSTERPWPAVPAADLWNLPYFRTRWRGPDEIPKAIVLSTVVRGQRRWWVTYERIPGSWFGLGRTDHRGRVVPLRVRPRGGGYEAYTPAEEIKRERMRF